MCLWIVFINFSQEEHEEFFQIQYYDTISERNIRMAPTAKLINLD
jgi:hypothetical protein